MPSAFIREEEEVVLILGNPNEFAFRESQKPAEPDLACGDYELLSPWGWPDAKANQNVIAIGSFISLFVILMCAYNYL